MRADQRVRLPPYRTSAAWTCGRVQIRCASESMNPFSVCACARACVRACVNGKQVTCGCVVLVASSEPHLHLCRVGRRSGRLHRDGHTLRLRKTLCFSLRQSKHPADLPVPTSKNSAVGVSLKMRWRWWRRWWCPPIWNGGRATRVARLLRRRKHHRHRYGRLVVHVGGGVGVSNGCHGIEEVAIPAVDTRLDCDALS